MTSVVDLAATSKTVIDNAMQLGRQVAFNPSEVRAIPTIVWRRVLDKLRSRSGSDQPRERGDPDAGRRRSRWLGPRDSR